MNELLKLFDGKKTYLAAVGFVLLGFYQLVQGQGEAALQSFSLALSAVGIRHALTKSNEEQKLMLKKKD